MARELAAGEVTILQEVRRLLADPVTPAELAARRRAVDEIAKLRASMAPVDLTADELLADDDGEGD
jgi:hypothetical protein